MAEARVGRLASPKDWLIAFLAVCMFALAMNVVVMVLFFCTDPGGFDVMVTTLKDVATKCIEGKARHSSKIVDCEQAKEQWAIWSAVQDNIMWYFVYKMVWFSKQSMMGFWLHCVLHPLWSMFLSNWLVAAWIIWFVVFLGFFCLIQTLSTIWLIGLTVTMGTCFWFGFNAFPAFLATYSPF